MSKLEKIVKEAWSVQGGANNIDNWLMNGNSCRVNLMVWSRDPRLNPRLRIVKLRQRLSVLASAFRLLQPGPNIKLYFTSWKSYTIKTWLPIGSNQVRQNG